MEFLGNVLPILLFILFVVNKAKRQVPQDKSTNGRMNTERALKPAHVEDKKVSSKHKEFKNFRNIGEILRKELNTAMEEMMQVKKIGSQENSNAEMMEQKSEEIDKYGQEYNRNMDQRKEERLSKEMQETEIRDRIYKNEIGNAKLLFRKNEILNGIILSEVLSKPKSLRK
ncbi:MAG: hypothetical protein AB2421_19060 [Thermotaleaceae bacterium]